MRLSRTLLVCSILLFAAPFTAAQPPDARVTDIDSELRLRAAPTINSDILDLLPAETALTVIGRNDATDWLEVITPQGRTGWVAADYVDVFVDLDALSITDGVNGLDRPLVLPPPVVAHIREIYALGQVRGNRPGVFSKVGDSITATQHFLHPVGAGVYDLGEFEQLQSVIAHFSTVNAHTGNSFTNESLAAGNGWTSSAVVESPNANPDICLPNEIPLVCEYRMVQPAYALIMFGSNDVAHLTARRFRINLSEIVEISQHMGIVPVLSTFPDRVGYEQKVIEFNGIIIAIARDYEIPLWNYAGVLRTLDDGGLAPDGVHPSIAANGYNGAADFRAGNLYYGYVLRNLTALHMLDAVWQATQVEAGL